MKLVTNDYGCGTSSSIFDYGIKDVIVVSENDYEHVFDADDDNDGRLTRDEVVETMYTVNPGDSGPTLASNEIEVNREVDPITGVITITTITYTDTDGDGIADYIDSDS